MITDINSLPRFVVESLQDAGFWSKVRENPETGCWEWQGTVAAVGYGQYRHNGILGYAHHFVLDALGLRRELAVRVCHSCDNKICVRPSHLFLGTDLDNMRDATSKGRCDKPSLRRARCQLPEHVNDPRNFKVKVSHHCLACEREKKRESRASDKQRKLA